LAISDLEAADVDPPGRAALRLANPVDHRQDQPEDGDAEQRVRRRPEQLRVRPAGDQHQRQADRHANQLLEEILVGRVPQAQVEDRPGGQHHHQPEPEQQRGDAADQVIRRQRPAHQGPPGLEPLADAGDRA
jgi:hypothetical protein